MSRMAVNNLTKKSFTFEWMADHHGADAMSGVSGEGLSLL